MIAARPKDPVSARYTRTPSASRALAAMVLGLGLCLGAAPAAALPPAALANPTAISDVAERSVKSVVSIQTSKLVRGMHGRGGFEGLPWGHPFGRRRAPDRHVAGAGSGVIVSADGVVLTNNHVVEGAEKIRVTTHDRRTFTAKLVGRDARTDLAVLQLEGLTGKLIPLPMADSDKLRLGEVVLAIGNSFGRLSQTVTAGIVSAKGRGDVGIVDYEDFIQTDAAINPGNSGGALVNLAGELVGINTAIASRSGGSQGVGFAIPSNMVAQVMDAIVAHGQLDRGWLGVAIQDISAEMAEAFGLPDRNGVLIGDVAPTSPAAKAGLRRGDVVLRINGKRTVRSNQLRNVVGLAGAGKAIKVEVWRDGKRRNLSVKLGTAPDQRKRKRPARAKRPATSADQRLGLTLAPLDQGMRHRLGIGPEIQAGIVITHVDAGSLAQRAGLAAGDVILEVGRRPVADVDAALRVLDGARGRVLLLVRRGPHSRYTVLPLK